jgi:hypothetical protein
MTTGTNPLTSVYTCGIDWLTMTHPDTAEVLGWREEQLHKVALELSGGLAGQERRVWRWQGYTGWAFCGVRWGTSRQGSVIQSSGHTAHSLAAIINWQGYRCTRVDLQVTCRTAQNDGTRAVRALELMAVDSRSRAGRGAPHAITSIDGHGSGYTLQLGRRASDRYVRVYDKGRESRDEQYAGMVRLELEAKGDLARDLWAKLEAQYFARSFVQEYVGSTLARYGLAALAELTPDVPLVDVSYSETPSDLESRLEWLRTSVRPVIRRLLADGRYYDILDALELDRRGDVPS